MFVIPPTGFVVFTRLMVTGNEAKHITSYRFLNLFHYRYLTFSSYEFYGFLQLSFVQFGVAALFVPTLWKTLSKTLCSDVVH